MPLWRGGAAPVHRPAGSSEAGARGQQIGAAEEVERPEAATRERGIGYVAIKDVVDDQLQPETVVDIEADGPVDQRIRLEESRGGRACVSKWRARWSPDH